MVDHATPNLPMRDADATARFYGGLGFEVRHRDPAWMILARGSITLEFFPHPDLDPATSSFGCCVRVADVAGLHAVFRAAGVPERTTGWPRLEPPRVEPWGGTVAALVDPDGTLLRLVQAPVEAPQGAALLATAAALAIELHAGQVRKGTTIPYVQHPLEVAATALRHGATSAQAAAALLHDVVEDCGGPPVLERVRAGCGDAVAAMVMACTDAAPAPGEAKPPWRERKEAYLAHLEHAPVDALLVSAADKLSNAAAIVRDLEDPAIGAAVWDRFTAGRDGQRWYYAALAEVIGRRLPGPLADELAAMVGRLLARSAAG